jgi:GR25 family glycosyltransferase involved in LPS biosynthesis
MSQNIDHIFYINLDKRLDRKNEIEEEMKKMNLSVERFRAIPFSPGIVGCGYSHMNVLRLAKDRGYKNVLIFEDDFQFLVSKEEFEENLTLFFENVKEYDVCMLAYNIQKWKETEYPFLMKVLEAQTASAYIVHERFYDRLINLLEENMEKLKITREHWNYANDQCWKRLQPWNDWFCFSLRLGKQRPSYSDNSLTFQDYGL